MKMELSRSRVLSHFSPLLVSTYLASVACFPALFCRLLVSVVHWVRVFPPFLSVASFFGALGCMFSRARRRLHVLLPLDPFVVLFFVLFCCFFLSCIAPVGRFPARTVDRPVLFAFVLTLM